MGGEGPLKSYLLITLTAIDINAVENLEEWAIGWTQMNVIQRWYNVVNFNKWMSHPQTLQKDNDPCRRPLQSFITKERPRKSFTYPQRLHTNRLQISNTQNQNQNKNEAQIQYYRYVGNQCSMRRV